MALLVEGLGVGVDTSIEEYIIGPANELFDDQEYITDKEQVTLYGPEVGLSWVARPVKGQSVLGAVSRHGSSFEKQGSIPLMDPLVTLFGSVHEKLPGLEMGSMRSTLFPNFGSMFSVTGPKTEHWDVETGQREGDDYASEAAGADSDDNLHSPLLSPQTTSMEGKEIMPPHAAHGSVLSMRRNSSLMQGGAEAVSSMGIGGGWQLAWKWSEHDGADGKKEGGFKRIYLHQEGVLGSRRGSLLSLPGQDVPEDTELIQAAALVSQPALYSKELMEQHPVGPAMVHPSETVDKGSILANLLEPGVRQALIVGVGIQILQQVSHFGYFFFIFYVNICTYVSLSS